MSDIALLDPWHDAAEIARRLADEDARLVAVLGAESWCEKCRAARPVLEAQLRAMQAAETNGVFLWLDVEEHAEFLGSYLPEDLPWLVAYEGERLVAVGHIEPPLPERLEQLQTGTPSAADPGLRRRFMTTDWAMC